jgi:hypothetical protein
MNPILSYFDLNRRINIKPVLVEEVDQSSLEGSALASSSLTLVAPPSGSVSTKAQESLTIIPLWQQGIFYLGTVIGVLFSSSVMQFQAGKIVSPNFTVISILLSAVIALVLMPVIYQQAIKPDSPFIVQLGLFVQAGISWSVLFTVAARAFG